MAQGRKRNRKWLWISLGVILVGAAVIIGVVIWQNNNGGGKNDEAVMPEAEKQETAQTEATIDAEVVNAQGEKQKVVQYEGEDPNTLEELTGVVTYAGVNGENLMVRVSIDQYLTEGSCELTLTRGGATIYNSIADIVGDVATATCKGFDIPVAELGGGEVQININLKADGKSGEIRGEASI
ncbi:hypothetical protein IKF89_00960 [Candidatus Saccharibacteria bacterium]|nr:hypothetical protein [Candidatus Saccharibacteria bacterium]